MKNKTLALVLLSCGTIIVEANSNPTNTCALNKDQSCRNDGAACTEFNPWPWPDTNGGCDSIYNQTNKVWTCNCDNNVNS